MNHLSLFSGIGGLDLAAEAAGFKTVAFVERDSYCQRVLRKHWPDVPIFGDVREIAADTVRGGCRTRAGREKECLPTSERGVKSVEQSRVGWFDWFGEDGEVSAGILTGGFPCQPHSVAGSRKASGDERDLWDECVRITSEFGPRWCVFENVPGLLSSERGSFFARILDDLAALGYSVGWGVWGAVDVGAPHRRDRIFIVAHSRREGVHEQRKSVDAFSQGGEQRTVCSNGLSRRSHEERKDVAHSTSIGQSGQGEPIQWSRTEKNGERQTDFPISMCGRSIWSVEPELGRVADGVPNRAHRLRALGNAVVPQQAYPIFKAIAEIEGI